MDEIDLSNPLACNAEIVACSRGLAYLDHMFGQIVDSLSEAEAVMETVESDAAKAARSDAPSAATAAEIKGLMTSWINARPSASQARTELRKAQDRKAKIDRWLRSLEKRMSAAQSALNGHQSLARYGGGS